MIGSITDIEILQTTCIGCGKPFTPANVRQTRCSHDCGRTNQQKHAARTEHRKSHDVTFIGVDGEGWGTGSKHNYCLLSVGEESIYHSDGSRLHILEIFDFLWQQYLKNRDAAFVGYYLGYDFTQWFRTLPGERARMLLSKEGIAKRKPKNPVNPIPFPVEWRGWKFDILNYKRFKLQAEGSSEWLYVCDAGSFFQTSFLNAIDPKNWQDSKICTEEELETIREGKSQRGIAGFDEKMVRYNITENRVMSRLMTEYNRGLVKAGLYLNREQWFGPGQAAQEWLNTINAPTRKIVEEKTPAAYRDAARAAYYGGWFEITAHGPIPGETHEYDINSAYPAVIATLPCLLHGYWSQGDKSIPFKSDTYTLVHVETEGKNHWLGGLPWRSESGKIAHPNGTFGWYWHHEVEAARRAKLIKTIDFVPDENGVAWYRYVPCDCPPPLRSIADLYKQRLEVGKNTAEGKALKLVYNSAYGKQAQSLGSPKYANAIYASLITAGCRIMILDAIATHPKGAADVMMIATDGIYFRTPHTNIKLSPTELGAWDHSSKSNLSLFMPGVYWDDKSRERIASGQSANMKSRGVNAADLSNQIGWIDFQWSEYKPSTREWVDNKYVTVKFKWPDAHIHIGFDMVSATQALARGAWESAGFVSTDAEKVLSSDPSTKRDVDSLVLRDGVLRSRPNSMAGFFESVPYAGTFGDEMRENMALREFMSPDGDPLLWTIRELNGID